MVTLTSPLLAPADLAPLDPLGIEARVGRTPLLDLGRLAAAHGVHPRVGLFAKAEWFNPSGSVKDRPALNIIRTAEHLGLLRPGMTLLDSTSGNMGIAYAMLGAARGYRVKLALPANCSPERLAILRAYGADLLLTDPLEGSDGAIEAARALAAQHPEYYYADQYNNPANWQAHYFGTAAEIWEQTDGAVTHFVAGLGTSGTFTGVTRGLRARNATVRCISAQPSGPFNGLEGWKHMPTALVPGIYDATLADDNIPVQTEAAYELARELARSAGLFVSPSAAAAVVAALQIARSLTRGVVVTVLPDNGFKYLSERFWRA